MPSVILSDNGVSSGSAGLKSTAASDGVLVLQTTTSGGTATNALSISNTQAITVVNTGTGVTFSSSAGSGLRVYGASGTNQWDMYLNSTNLRFSDNTGGGVVAIDTAARVGSTLGVGGTTPSTSGAGITFPATQSASTDANTLDDYEEGTFTPTLTFGGGSTGITYTAGRTGMYTKVGNLVTIQVFIELTNKGSSTGSAKIEGLPFTVKQLSASWSLSGGGSGLAWGSMGTNLQYTQTAPIANTTTLFLFGQTAGTTAASTLTQTDFSNSGYLGFTMTYQVA